MSISFRKHDLAMPAVAVILAAFAIPPITSLFKEATANVCYPVNEGGVEGLFLANSATVGKGTQFTLQTIPKDGVPCNKVITDEQALKDSGYVSHQYASTHGYTLQRFVDGVLFFNSKGSPSAWHEPSLFLTGDIAIQKYGFIPKSGQNGTLTAHANMGGNYWHNKPDTLTCQDNTPHSWALKLGPLPTAAQEKLAADINEGKITLKNQVFDQIHGKASFNPAENPYLYGTCYPEGPKTPLKGTTNFNIKNVP